MPVLVRDEMCKNVVVAEPRDSVKLAVKIMSSKDIGCIVSVDKNKPVGILTERDIMKRIVAPGLDAEKTLVRDVMTRKLIGMESTTSVQDAVDLLEKKKIKRLPVIEHGKLMGIITMTDLLRCMRRLEGEEAKELKKAIKDLHLTKIKLQTRIIELEEKMERE